MSYAMTFILGILAILFVVFVFFLLLSFILRGRFAKQSEGGIYATIIKQGGARRDTLLYFNPDVDDQVLDVKKGSDGIVRKQPYYVRGDKTWNLQYPPNFPKPLTVTVRSAIYAENNPEPFDPFLNPPVITSEVLGNLQDTNFSRAMVARAEEITEAQVAEIPKKFYYVVIGAALLSLITAFIAAYLAMSIQAIL